MRHRAARRQSEPTIALINIVFLMLIFFLVAGTIAPTLDKSVRLVSVAEIEGTAPPNALVLHADGRMTHRGKDIPSAAAFLDGFPIDARTRVRIVPDRALPAETLVEVGMALRDAGASHVVLVTERGLR